METHPVISVCQRPTRPTMLNQMEKLDAHDLTGWGRGNEGAGNMPVALCS